MRLFRGVIADVTGREVGSCRSRGHNTGYTRGIVALAPIQLHESALLGLCEYRGGTAAYKDLRQRTEDWRAASSVVTDNVRNWWVAVTRR